MSKKKKKDGSKKSTDENLINLAKIMADIEYDKGVVIEEINYNHKCVFCGKENENFHFYHGKPICNDCLVTIFAK